MNRDQKQLIFRDARFSILAFLRVPLPLGSSLVSLKSFDRAGIDTFEKKKQIGAVDFDRLVFSIDEAHVWKSKGSRLQAFGEDRPTVPIPPKCFNDVPPSTAKEKQMSGICILPNGALHELE